MTAATMPDMRLGRLPLTGAGGGFGPVRRSRLKPHGDTQHLSDLADSKQAAADEELVPSQLENANAVLALLAGAGAMTHLSGVSTE